MFRYLFAIRYTVKVAINGISMAPIGCPLNISVISKKIRTRDTFVLELGLYSTVVSRNTGTI